VILNEPLARRLQARSGEDVLIRMGPQGAISAETLLGRRMSRRRPACDGRPGHSGGWMGCFDLRPAQQDPYNAFVPLALLQRAVKQRGELTPFLCRTATRSLRNGFATPACPQASRAALGSGPETAAR